MDMEGKYTNRGTKMAKGRKHCGNCGNHGDHMSATTGLWAHHVCKVKNVGEATEVAGEKCVCAWVEKKTKPRGCPGWQEV